MKILIYTAGYMFSIWGGSWIISKIVKPFTDRNIPSGFANAGKMIGQIERFIFYSSFIVNSHMLIGVVLTVKAIYRYGDISGDNETKMRISEYFIIGTLSSLAWVFIVFGLNQFILKIL